MSTELEKLKARVATIEERHLSAMESLALVTKQLAERVLELEDRADIRDEVRNRGYGG